MKRISIAVIILTSLYGCAITPIDLTNGEAKKATLIPEVHESTKTNDIYYVQIMSIDKQNIKGAWDKHRTPVYVTSGQHTIGVRVLRGSLDMGSLVINQSAAKKTLGTITATVKSGKRYLISAKAKEIKKTMFQGQPQNYTYSIKEYAGTESPVVKVNY